MSAPCSASRRCRYSRESGFIVHRENAQAGEWFVRAARRDAAPARSVAISDARSRGRRTVNTAPLPRPSLCTAMVPPCDSTSCLVMASPSPSPAKRRALPLSAWRNFSKMCGRNSAEMPSPLSRTSQQAMSALHAGFHRHHAVRGRELEGVRQQVAHHLLQAHRVAHDGQRRVAELGFDAHLARRDADAHRVERGAHRLVEIHGFEGQRQLARHELVGIEQVAQQLGLRARIAFDDLQAVGAWWRHRRAAAAATWSSRGWH